VVNWDYVAASYSAVQIGQGIDSRVDWLDDTSSKLEEDWKKLTGSKEKVIKRTLVYLR
jgi:hypothetical protein